MSSEYQKYLYELDPLVTALNRPSVLIDELVREARERKRLDDAWLATLSPDALAAELVQRRIASLERRLAAWWEEHMAWRFAARRPDEDNW